jgi:lysozyme
MKAPQAAIDLVKVSESCRLQAYQDTGGIWTIGYGHTHGVKEGDTCTQEQADEWLAEDMQEAVDDVLRLVKVNLTQGQFAALVDFVFNLGVGQFQHSTLLKRINDRDFGLAGSEFSRWVYDDGKILGGLVTRREREKALFRS